MKRILTIGLLPLLLLGCTSTDKTLDTVLLFRENLNQSSNVTFETEVTADYGEDFYTFSMLCSVDNMGNLSFTVTEPETIRDIQGQIGIEGGKLTFDNQVLAFNTMAAGRISPVSAPYVLMQALRGGYISSVAKTEEGFCVMVDDSYAEDALNLQIYFQGDYPVRGEIYWEQRRILTLQIEDFQLK